jgi:molybdate transport system substrate-binding protein
MNKRLPISAVFTVICVLILPLSAHAQLKVLMSGGFSAAYRDLLPEFERKSGITVMTTTGGSQGSGPNTIGAQLSRGVPVDMVIMNRAGLDELIAHNRIAPGTDIDLAETPLGLAVRTGMPKPDIRTVEAFKQTLLHAKSVSIDTSTDGIYFTTKLFPRLGIADEMGRKSITVGATAVAKGEAEIALQPVSELLPITGIELVGTLPADVQYAAVFSAAIVKGSKDVHLAQQLITFLSSQSATAAIKKSGMEPAKRKQQDQ